MVEPPLRVASSPGNTFHVGSRLAGRRPPAKRNQNKMLTSYEFVSAFLQSRCKTDRGASLVEYALLVALIAVVCIVAVTFLGKSASSKFSSVGSAVAG
jgi:pilus assembly protein Flp/PilA